MVYFSLPFNICDLLEGERVVVSILEVYPLLMFAIFFIIFRRLGGGGWGLISKRLEEERVLEEARMREEEGRCGGALWIFYLFLLILQKLKS